MKCVICNILTTGLLGILIATTQSGCSTKLQDTYNPGDCIMAGDGVYKVVAIGKYSLEVIDTYGNHLTMRGDAESAHRVDCFNRFKGLK